MVLKRRSHKAHKGRSASKRMKRSHGGVAPVSHQDMGWSAKVSLGQGRDFFDHHDGQHGGAALQGADLSSIGNDALPNQLRASAHISGLDKAFNDIRGLSDHSGGRRSRKARKARKARKSRKARSASRKSRKAHKAHKARSASRKSRKSHKRSHRRRGGALGYSSFPSAGMLLSSSEHNRAGLNPHWNDVEADMARARAGW